MDTPQKRIFLFSAGWRTGSTLLQRLITTSREVFMWGELHYLGKEYLNLNKQLEDCLIQWHNAEHLRQKLDSHIDNVEDANLNPPIEIKNRGFSSFLDTLYYYDDIANAFSGWGWKTVRYGEEMYNFLKNIFPAAYHVFLVRNPYHCLESAKAAGYYDGNGFRQTVFVYKKLLEEFHAIAMKEKVFVIRYEDLIGDIQTRNSLFSYLGIGNVDLNLLRNTSKSKHAALSNSEIKFVRSQLKIMTEFGYERIYKAKPSMLVDVYNIKNYMRDASRYIKKAIKY